MTTRWFVVGGLVSGFSNNYASVFYSIYIQLILDKARTMDHALMGRYMETKVPLLSRLVTCISFFLDVEMLLVDKRCFALVKRVY